MVNVVNSLHIGTDKTVLKKIAHRCERLHGKRNFEFLIPDAPELVANFLETEQDMSCKRNAFMMLIHVDQERALNYLGSCIDQVHTFGDILQLVIVELIYKVII
ncbi:coatomer subunit beta-like [Parasteatoda tepidariorum]|uniref:coatomer subunit beta-like n=1 Tax=Parasteatoda tepidariorum TaxID=114398 RepID=UPI0039BCB307